MPLFGLIGKKLSHSFSKKFFEEKFEQLSLTDHSYQLFELENINEVSSVFQSNGIRGFNVTVPYKEAIIPHLDRLDASARKVGAVNVVSIEDDEKIGYNSDYYGFHTSLKDWLSDTHEEIKALILGSGGASKAVIASLKDMQINYSVVSRTSGNGDLTYEELKGHPHLIGSSRLIINTTPLGMHPSTTSLPDLPYDHITDKHFLYDLVYNPEKTAFLKQGEQKGARIKNGLEMLHLQAERSWTIWSR